jgi:hypothetical protein
MSFYRIEIGRMPLVLHEKGIEGYRLDAESLDKAIETKALLAQHIEPVIEKPAAMFHDLLRQNHDGGLCYSAPLYWGASTKHVVLVFAERDGDWIEVFDWTWRIEDFRAPGLPLDWDKDFGELIWRAA